MSLYFLCTCVISHISIFYILAMFAAMYFGQPFAELAAQSIEFCSLCLLCPDF